MESPEGFLENQWTAGPPSPPSAIEEAQLVSMQLAADCGVIDRMLLHSFKASFDKKKAAYEEFQENMRLHGDAEPLRISEREKSFRDRILGKIG